MACRALFFTSEAFPIFVNTNDQLRITDSIREDVFRQVTSRTQLEPSEIFRFRLSESNHNEIIHTMYRLGFSWWGDFYFPGGEGLLEFFHGAHCPS